MRKLFFRLTLLVAICLAAFGVLFAVISYGYVDAFYRKFTYPAKSLIIGNSRAAQAILPQELEPYLGKKQFEGPLLNYAFTVTHSPFGPAYLESIKRKLPPETKNGLFIIAVDPWSLTGPKNAEPENNGQLPEQDGFIGNLTQVNNNPNIAYLKDFYQKPYYRLLADNLFPIEKPHKDGWLEIDVKMDALTVERRTATKLGDYSKKARNEQLAAIRLKSLEETIVFLKQHGTVYLVRIPVSGQMLRIENNFIPGFDSLMLQTGRKYRVPYFNYSGLSNRFGTIDGNHLHKEAGKEFSRLLARDIFMSEDYRQPE